MILHVMDSLRTGILLTLFTIFHVSYADPSSNTIYHIKRIAEPIRYDLYLRTILPIAAGTSKTTSTSSNTDQGSFYGTVKILVKLLQNTNTIELNCDDVQIEGEITATYHIENRNGQKAPLGTRMNGSHQNNGQCAEMKVKATNYEYVKEKQIVVITMSETLNYVHEYEFTINFKGKLSSLYYGYSYISSGNRSAAVTEFQPTGARRVFPCFDEPDMKAYFKITLSRPIEYKSLCNLPFVKSETEDSRFVKDSYFLRDVTGQKDVKMSTYVISFAIHDYGMSKQIKTHSDTTITIWSDEANPSTEYTKKINLALQYANIFLDYYQMYFSVEFPLKKLDLFVLNVETGVSSDESWGLIITKRDNLLGESEFNAPYILGHELAHFWIGNMVTGDSWKNFTWIKEGLAEYFAINQFHKYLDIDYTDALINTYNQISEAMKDDDLFLAKPLARDLVNNFTQVKKELFPTSIYRRAFSIIRMLKEMFGKDVFRTSLQNVMKKYYAKSATPEEFWSLFDDALHIAHLKSKSDENMKLWKVMETWATKTAYPVVMVNNDKINDVIRVTQAPALDVSDKKEKKKGENNDDCWLIPLNYTTKNEKDFQNTLVKAWAGCEELIINKSAEWVIFNLNSSGYYRVNYDKQNWSKIAEILLNEPNTVPTLTRYRIVSDVMFLAFEGQIPYEVTFNVLMFLKEEKSYIVWEAALNGFGQLLNFVDDSTTLTKNYTNWKLAVFLRPLLKPLYEQFSIVENILSFPEKLEDQKLKQLIIKWACFCGVTNCQNKLVALYADATVGAFKNFWRRTIFRKSRPEIPYFLAEQVLCFVLVNGNSATWMNIKKETSTGLTLEEKVVALTCIADKTSIQQYISLLRYGEVKNLKNAFNEILMNTAAYDDVVKFYFDENTVLQNQIRQQNPGNSVKVDKELRELEDIVSTYLRTENELKKLGELHKTVFKEDLPKEVKHRVKRNMDWIKNVRPKLLETVHSWKTY